MAGEIEVGKVQVRAEFKLGEDAKVKFKQESTALGRDAGLAQAQAMAKAAEQQFRTDMARVKEGQARGFLQPAEAAKAGREAAEAYNRAMIQALDQGARTGAFRGGAGQKLFTQMAGSLKDIGTEGRRAGIGIQSLREPLTTLVYTAAGANAAFGRMSSILLSFAAGGTVTVAVLAGLGLMVLAWNKLTAAQRESRNATEEAGEALDKLIEKRRIEGLGPGGEVGEQVGRQEAERARLEADRQRVIAGLRILAQMSAAERGALRESGLDNEAQLLKRLDEINEAYVQVADRIRQGEAEVAEVRLEAQNEAAEKEREAAERAHRERLAETERQIRELAERIEKWVKEHGLGASGDREPGMFSPFGGLSNKIRTPPVEAIGLSNREQAYVEGLQAQEKAAEEVARAAAEAAREMREQVQAAESAARSAVNLASALGVVDEGIARTLDALVGLGASLATGNVAGSIAAGAAFLANIVVGNDREREAREQAARELADLAEAAARAAQALTEFVRGLERDLIVRRLEATGQSDEAARAAMGIRHSRELEELASQGAPLEKFFELAEVHALEMEQLNQQIRERIELEKQQAAEAAAAAAERARQFEEERKAAEDNLRVRLLYAQGLTEEADELQRLLDNQREYQDALEMYGQAMADLTAQVQAAEEAARQAAAAEAALAEERNRARAVGDLFDDVAVAEGSEDPSIKWRRKWGKILDDAAAAANRGDISQTDFWNIATRAQADFDRMIAEGASAPAEGLPTSGGRPFGGGPAAGEVASSVRGVTEFSAIRLTDAVAIQTQVLHEILGVERRQLEALLGRGVLAPTTGMLPPSASPSVQTSYNGNTGPGAGAFTVVLQQHFHGPADPRVVGEASYEAVSRALARDTLRTTQGRDGVMTMGGGASRS